jgi:hypothetical protein
MVALEWDGHRWQELATLVEYEESASIDSDYRARRLTVQMDLGSTALEMIAAGHHPASAVCAVWYGSGLAYRGAVSDLIPGRAGEPSTLRLVGNAIDLAAMVPNSLDVQMRQINVARSQARQARQEAEIAASINEAYGFAGRRPLYLTVLEPGEVAPRMNGLGDGRAVVWYVETSDTVVVAERAVGRVYPWVHGQPGVETGRVGTRAYPIDVDTQTLMIAGHHGTEGTVSVRGPKHGATDQHARETLTATNSYDAAGRPVMTVTVAGSSVLEHRWLTSHPEAAEADWYVIWEGTASGLPNNAIDVIETLLSAQSAPVDYARIESLRGELAGYTLDGVIDGRVGVWDLLQSAILPLLPVALVDTVDGVGLVRLRLDATAADSQGPLVAGRDIDPIGRPSWQSSSDPDAIANRITVSYAPSRETAAPAASVTVSASTHAAAARSLAIHGDRPREIVTGWVHRAAVAETIARDVLQRSAVDRRVVEYAVDALVFGLGAVREIRLGDVYTVTDADEMIADAVALVTAVRRDGSGTDVVRLLLLT